MGWVLIYQVWNEENSVTIDAWGCCWLSTCKTGVQPDRMQKRYVQALYLSPGFSDFGICHIGIANMGVGCESGGRKGFMGWIRNV